MNYIWLLFLMTIASGIVHLGAHSGVESSSDDGTTGIALDNLDTLDRALFFVLRSNVDSLCVKNDYKKVMLKEILIDDLRIQLDSLSTEEKVARWNRVSDLIEKIISDDTSEDAQCKKILVLYLKEMRYLSNEIFHIPPSCELLNIKPFLGN